MKADRDGRFRSLLHAAQEQGWTVTYTGGGHYKFLPADKSQPPIYTSSSPGDVRAVRNIEAQLRRAGLVLP